VTSGIGPRPLCLKRKFALEFCVISVPYHNCGSTCCCVRVAAVDGWPCVSARVYLGVVQCVVGQCAALTE
jgi:hypothetical protein